MAFPSTRSSNPARRTANRLHLESLETRLAMAFTPVGVPTRVSDYDPAFATETDVAMDAQGNFVAVWSEGDGPGSATNSRLFGRKFDHLGQPVGDAFRLNTIDNDPEGVRIKMAPDGRFVAAWQSHPSIGSLINDVYVRRFAADCTPLGTELLVTDASDDGFQDYNPDLAINSQGAFIVSWEGGIPRDPLPFGGTHVFARRYSSDGEPLGNEFKVDLNTVCSNEQSSVALADDGGFAVSWGWSNSCTLPPIPSSAGYIRTFRADGTESSIAEYVDSGGPIASLGSSAAGYAQALLSIGNAPNFFRDLKLLTPSGASTVVDRTDDSISNMQITRFGDSILLSWVANHQPRLRLFSRGGLPLSSEIAPNGATIDGPSHPAIALADNYAVLVFATNSGHFFYRYSLNPFPGDVNGDERVNLHDFALLRSNFGQTDKQRHEGDLTGDGKVDMQDFGQLRANFGRKAAASMSAGFVTPSSDTEPVVAAGLVFSSSLNATTDRKKPIRMR